MEIPILPEPPYSGNDIIVLDPSDVSNPEVLAMLQAMYSRSGMSIKDRLAVFAGDERVSTEERLKNNMQTYYVGYGHASIADMANVAVFVENVSMLAAKAIQDDPLYNGQERSTRYQDFGTVPYLAADPTVSNLNERWRSLYAYFQPKVETYFFDKYLDPEPFMSEEELRGPKRNALWAKTVKAMAFDVTRSLLPCGATTSLSVYMSLRRFRHLVKRLITHPLPEVRGIAVKINAELYARYPHSFLPIDPETVHVVSSPYLAMHVPMRTSTALITKTVNLKEMGGNFFSNEWNHFHFMIAGCIDFGSFRDLQRHRNGLQQMPLVQPSNGFHNYYRNILAVVDQEAWSLCLDIMDNLMILQDRGYNNVALQYGCPMGTMVPTNHFWSFEQVKYVCELRSNTSVHPTMREWAHDLFTYLPLDLAKHVKMDNRGDYIKSSRGSQDIVKKDGAS
jgi:thymidylate synthase ThyX